MKSHAFKLGCLVCASIGVFLFTGCSSFTYENQSWRVAEVSDSSADVIVRYIGIGVTSKNINERAEKAKELIELANEESPVDPITPKLRDASRRVFVQDGKIVVEESGTVRNPLSWFEQTGLNVLNWFYDPIDLSISGRYIIKSGWGDPDILLATNGRVTDEDTFASSRLSISTPLAIGGDTQWLRDEPLGLTDLAEREKHQIIVWPRASRLFYWKLSGPAFNKDWQSLAPEFIELIKETKTELKTEAQAEEKIEMK